VTRLIALRVSGVVCARRVQGTRFRVGGASFVEGPSLALTYSGVQWQREKRSRTAGHSGEPTPNGHKAAFRLPAADISSREALDRDHAELDRTVDDRRRSTRPPLADDRHPCLSDAANLPGQAVRGARARGRAARGREDHAGLPGLSARRRQRDAAARAPATARSEGRAGRRERHRRDKYAGCAHGRRVARALARRGATCGAASVGAGT
jgi:hypothetical protein